jgi:hypothetical protein
MFRAAENPTACKWILVARVGDHDLVRERHEGAVFTSTASVGFARRVVGELPQRGVRAPSEVTLSVVLCIMLSVPAPTTKPLSLTSAPLTAVLRHDPKR